MLIQGTTIGAFGYGAMDSSGNQYAATGSAWGGAGAGQNSIANTTHCIMFNKWSTTTTPLMSAKYVSMDSDGFTINVDVASSDSMMVAIAYEASW